MPRIPLPGRTELDEAQAKIYDDIVAGPRGQVIGPLRAVIHSPELADRWQKLGEILRFGTVLPKKLNELAIIVTGRRWNAQIEWWVHARVAGEAGLPAEVIESIRLGETPVFTDAAEAEIYDFARELQTCGTPTLPVYNAIVARWGARGAVELVGVIGYYTMVSMTLNAHEIPLPDGVAEPLQPLPQAHGALTPLPPAKLATPA